MVIEKEEAAFLGVGISGVLIHSEDVSLASPIVAKEGRMPARCDQWRGAGRVTGSQCPSRPHHLLFSCSLLTFPTSCLSPDPFTQSVQTFPPNSFFLSLIGYIWNKVF